MLFGLECKLATSRLNVVYSYTTIESGVFLALARRRCVVISHYSDHNTVEKRGWTHLRSYLHLNSSAKMSTGEYIYKTNIVDGVPFPHFIDKQRMDELRTFRLRTGDVFIVTYPKSGTAWLQQILKLIKNEGKEDGTKVVDVAPWIEALGHHMGKPIQVKVYDDLPSPRFFTSHTPYHMMPGGQPNTTPAKYIYSARNPKDVAVSFFHHARAWSILGPYHGPWDHFFRMFMDGKMDSGLWFDHVLEWWKHKDDPNVLFLKFEDMKRDLPGAVKQIAEFIGYEVSPEVISSITEQSTFESMKANDACNFSWVPPHVRSKTASKHLRKGVIGDWRNHFTVEQSAELEAVYAEKMKGSGLNFDF